MRCAWLIAPRVAPTPKRPMPVRLPYRLDSPSTRQVRSVSAGMPSPSSPNATSSTTLTAVCLPFPLLTIRVPGASMMRMLLALASSELSIGSPAAASKLYPDDRSDFNVRSTRIRGACNTAVVITIYLLLKSSGAPSNIKPLPCQQRREYGVAGMLDLGPVACSLVADALCHVANCRQSHAESRSCLRHGEA